MNYTAIMQVRQCMIANQHERWMNYRLRVIRHYISFPPAVCKQAFVSIRFASRICLLDKTRFL